MLLAFPDIAADGCTAESLDREQSEADIALSGYGKAAAGAVDIRPADCDAVRGRERDIFQQLRCIAHHRGHQCSKIFRRPAAFEIGSLIGDARIGGRMGFIERIARKGGHTVKDRVCNILRHAVCNGAAAAFVSVNENLPLLLHDAVLFLRHCTAHQIGTAVGIARKRTADLHNLLLIDDAAEGFFEDRLQQRMIVAHLFRVGTRREILRDRLHRPRPVKRDQGGEIGNAGRLHLHKHPPQPVRFHLKHADAVALCEHPEHGGVILRNVRHAERRLSALDLALCLPDDRQVAQAEKIHFQQAELLQNAHCILRDNGIIALLQRHLLHDRHRRDHNARCMDAGMTRKPLQLRCKLQQLFDLRVFAAHRLQLRRGGGRLFQRDIEILRDRL